MLESLSCRSVASGATAALVTGTIVRFDEVGRWQREPEIEQATGSPLQREPRTTVLTDERDRRAGDAPVLGDLSGGVASLGHEAESRSDRQPAQRIEARDPGDDRLLPTDMRACARWVRSQARPIGKAHARA